MTSLKHFLLQKTSRHVAINTSGSYLSAFFTLTFTLILTRSLSAAEYGTQSVILALTYVVTNILDFGISGATYSFLPGLLARRASAISFLKSNLFLQTSLALLTVALLIPTLPILNAHILKTHVPERLYIWAVMGIPLYVMQNFILNSLFASKKFLEGTTYSNSSHLFKLIVLLVLIFAGNVTIEALVFLFAVAGPLCFLTLVLMRRGHLVGEFLSGTLERDAIKLRYTGQYFISEQLFTLATRLDLFLVSYFLPQSSVGLYALAQKIITNVLTFVGSVTQVLSPEFSLIKTKREAISQIKKSLMYLSIPSLIFGLALIMPDAIYTLFFTQEFVHASPVTRVLAVSYMGVALMAAPVLFLLYTVRKPGYLIVANVILFTTSLSLSVILIPRLHLLGAPIAIFFAYMANFLYIGFVTRRELARFTHAKNT